MIRFDAFPGGKQNAVTFSYDDGKVGDIRLMEIFRRYGIKGTFHIFNRPVKELTPEELAERDRLRRIYIDSVKANLVGSLENTYTVDENGNKRKLTQKQ